MCACVWCNKFSGVGGVGLSVACFLSRKADLLSHTYHKTKTKLRSLSLPLHHCHANDISHSAKEK